MTFPRTNFQKDHCKRNNVATNPYGTSFYIFEAYYKMVFTSSKQAFFLYTSFSELFWSRTHSVKLLIH